MDNISIIKNDKFKDVLITLRFAGENKDKNTERALLALMLVDRIKNYDTKVKMSEKLDNMFGASLNSSVRAYGRAHIIDISLSVLSSHYVDEDLLEKQIEFLSEIIYQPLLNEEVFNEAKLTLGDILARNSDNLGVYSILEALKIAGSGYPLENTRNGNLESLEKIELADVLAMYNQMLESDSLNIIVVGDVEEARVRSLFKKYFKQSNSKAFLSNYLVEKSELSEVVKETQTLQAYFTIVYNTHTLNVGRDYWILQLMSMILGQLPNSLLFDEVREKRSLGYSIRSSVIGYDGILFINGGVLLEGVDEAVDVSLAQVKNIQEGLFSEKLFSAAKVMLINSIYQTEDSSSRLIDSYYRQIILAENSNTDDLVEIIESINFSEVVEISKRLKLNTIYKLVNEEELV